MNHSTSTRTATKRARLAACIALSALLSAACGLGMNTEKRLARAEESLAAGDARAAIIDAKNVLLDEPENRAARRVLGMASLAAGDAAAAEKELRRAIELGASADILAPSVARAMLLQGRLRDVVDEFDPAAIADAEARLSMQRVLADTRLALREPEAARDLYTAVLDVVPTDAAAQLGVVNSYIAEGNLQQARATLSQVLDQYPDYAPAWLTSGRLHFNVRDFAAAAVAYEKANDLADESGTPTTRLEATFGLAETAFAENRIDDARRHAAVLRELAPDSLAARYVAARLAFLDEDWIKAQEELTQILRRAPNNNMARTLLGAVHLQSGNYEQAEMYLSATVADDPRNADARRLLAETRLQLNKSGEAAAALQPILGADQADAQSLAMAARVSFLSGDFDTAATYLERSAKQNPASSNVQLDLAMAYLLSGRLEDARAALDAAPSDDSDDNAFRRDAMSILTESQEKDVETALASITGLVERWPNRSSAHALRGALLMSVGDAAEARKAFEKARQLEPENVSAIRYLARLEFAEGNLATASSLYRRILDIRPSDGHALHSLGVIAVRNERPQDAVEWLEKARSADPNSLAPRVLLAELYGTSGRYDAAEQVALEANRLNDSVPSVHNILGVSSFGKKAWANAADSFSRAIELDPENRNYSLNLARAYAADGSFRKALATLGAGDPAQLEHLPTGLMIASVQAKSDDIAAAMKTTRALRQIHTDNAAPIALEAEMLAQRGDLIEAVRVYDEALGVEMLRWVAMRASAVRQLAGRDDADEPLRSYLAARPADVGATLALAELLQQRDQTAEAIETYEKLLEIAPQNFVGVNNLAWLYFTAGDPRAEEIARQARKLAPENASVADTLGWILVQDDKLDEGISLLREAVAMSNHPEIRYHLAAALAESGSAGEARRILQEILDKKNEFPSRADAQSLLASL